jgi:hypothetical protein
MTAAVGAGTDLLVAITRKKARFGDRLIGRPA